MACGTCLIVGGIAPSCTRKEVGGAQKRFWITPACNITATTIGVDTVVDSFTMALGAVFYEVFTVKDSLSVTESLTLPNGFITQTITGRVSLLSDKADLDLAAAEAITFADLLTNPAGEPLVAIIETRTNVRRVFGIARGLEPSAGEMATGAAISDTSGFTFTLVAGEDGYAPVLDSTYTIPV